MRVVKLKSNKHVDVIMEGDAHCGPAAINVVTRVRPTVHGDIFKALVEKAVPEVIKGFDPVMPQRRQETIVKDVVGLCALAASHAVDCMRAHPELGVVVPSYDTLMEKLRGAERQSADDDKIVSLAGRQGEEP